MVLAMMMALVIGQFDSQDTEIRARIRDEILKTRAHRVGVVPCFIIHQGETETLGGTFGPEAARLAKELTDALVEESKGRYRVVDHRLMAQSFRGLTLDDLGRREV